MSQIDYTEADLRHNAGYPDAPILPYAGTSGWKGSEASRDRAVIDDANGTTANRQSVALLRVRVQQYRGLTWKELGEMEDLHAGQSSGALSNLHKAGLIVRLTRKRGRCSIYVTPNYVDGREISPYKLLGKTKDELCRAIVECINLDPKIYTDGEVVDKIYSLLVEEGY
jgi:hypothetical protein